MKKILILDNYDSFTYNLVHYVTEILKHEVDVFRNDKITVAAVANYDIIILSPGPGLPKDAGILKAIIKQYAPTKKILGVCLGMQAIGEVFGGTLHNLERVYHGVATPIKVVDTQDVLYANLELPITVGRYHSWVVSHKNFPECLHVTAVAENNQIMSFKHKDYEVYGVQYHPESILTKQGKVILSNFLNHN